jgi:general secretion pathway protein K
MPRAAPSRRRERGVAMIIAVISIAILTAVAVDFRYNAHVDLRTAANQRDEAQAYFLAKSSVALSRLVLSFQSALDNMKIPGLGAIPGMPPGGAVNLNIQIYKLARVDCHMLRAMVGSSGEEPEPELPRASAGTLPEGDVAAPPARSFGGFTGCFDSQIDSEDTKIGVQVMDTATVLQVVQLLSDKRLEFLFESEDRNRVKVTPQELLINFADWTDEDQVQETLDFTKVATPFVDGFSDENYGYSRYEPRYEAKNAYFDSLDELYMVHGVNDQMMAALRDRVSVYLPLNAVANINTDDPLLLFRAILASVDLNKLDPRLNDPLFVVQLIQQIRAARSFAFLGLDVPTFLAILNNQGLVTRADAKSKLTTKTTTYSIHASGTAGAITKKLTAVIRMDGQGAAAGGNMGRLVYWREE